MFKAYADSVKVALQSCAAIATHSLQIVELTIATFPHHKHTPAGVIDSSAPAFAAVLAEIEQVIYGLHR